MVCKKTWSCTYWSLLLCYIFSISYKQFLFHCVDSVSAFLIAILLFVTLVLTYNKEKKWFFIFNSRMIIWYFVYWEILCILLGTLTHAVTLLNRYFRVISEPVCIFSFSYWATLWLWNSLFNARRVWDTWCESIQLFL